MRNTLLVIKHEIQITLGKPSFWLTSFLFPLIIFGLTFGSQILSRGMAGEDSDSGLLGEILGTADGPSPIAYVDNAALLARIPEGFPEALLRPYASVEAAREALVAHEIDQYYLIPDDFAATGTIVLTQDQFSPFEQITGDNLFEYLVTYNLTEDADIAALLLNPTPQVTTERVIVGEAVEPETPEGGIGTSVAPMAMLFIFFFVLTMSSGYMLRSVTKEKENRVVEVLLLSLRPRELMLGKILGLGLVALVQMSIWLGGGLLVLGRNSPIVAIVGSMVALDLPPGFVVWAVVYFLLGYLMFASLLGALGTLAPTMREGSQFTFLLLLPLMLPLWLNTAFIESPNGTLVTAFSIFPLTSPVSMVTRMTAVSVPLWQSLLSVGLLAVSTYALVLLSAKLFRADTLLSQAPLNFERLKKAFTGRLT